MLLEKSEEIAQERMKRLSQSKNNQIRSVAQPCPTLCNQRWSNTFADSIQSAKTRPGTNSGSDLELIFPIFRLK